MGVLVFKTFRKGFQLPHDKISPELAQKHTEISQADDETSVFREMKTLLNYSARYLV